jgi:hypothetical protein
VKSAEFRGSEKEKVLWQFYIAKSPSVKGVFEDLIA